MNPILDLIAGDADWGQLHRLLTLHTPAGPNVLLAEAATIAEALGPHPAHAGFRLALTALSRDAELSLTALHGQPARLDLQTSTSRTELRPFHGHITRVSRQGADGGFARYRLTIEPWLSFLGETRDSYLFQDKTIVEIVDELFSDWNGNGKVVPSWRWELADPAAYPKRGMTCQYRESDLAFLKRLLAEEGLFCWFEHHADSGDTLGSHTLVIADHNAAFSESRQARVRYTQAGATLSEDSVDRWHGIRQLDSSEGGAVSWDYRSLATRPQSAGSMTDSGINIPLVSWDDPGPYAWPTAEHGQRMIRRQREAADARLEQFVANGTLRGAAPGTLFTLADHPEHDHDPIDQRRFAITAVTHSARNNLRTLSQNSRGEDAPVDFYRNEFRAVRDSIPWRPLLADGHGRVIHPRPTADGTLTAVVVGEGESDATHTDRDIRVRVQFPWQRGIRSASRHPHPSGSDNAPANAGLGVWLRVLAPMAGANWGGHFTPRPGQEVLVAFQNGNIDRPIVIGGLYNGQGQPDAQGNRIGSATQNATPNAPAWFAGETDAAHTHGASLSGIKTQQLSTSRNGSGGYNQLVFDDAAGEARIELSTTEYASRLQLGHLKQQRDNARQANRGHGAELASQAAIALRAGSGLLVSADARSGANASHLDSREVVDDTDEALALVRRLAEAARKQKAGLKDEPGAEQLPATAALRHATNVLAGSTEFDQPAAATGLGAETFSDARAGAGRASAWSEARLQYSAPAGIAQLTPKNQILTADENLIAAAAQDIQLVAQGRHSLAAKEGIAFFTVGKAEKGPKPNTETGIHLHAASGKVSLQSQSGKTNAAADKTVTLTSTTSSVSASARQHVLMTAQGAYLRISGGDIDLHAPGKVELKASVKNLTAPRSVAVTLPGLPKCHVVDSFPHHTCYSQLFDLSHLLGNEPLVPSTAGLPYRVFGGDGQFISRGEVTASGLTERIFTDGPKDIVVLVGDGEWQIEERMEELGDINEDHLND